MALPSWTLNDVERQLSLGKWENSVITYSFPSNSLYMETDDTDFYGSWFIRNGFVPVINQQDEIRLALRLWDDLVARDFREVVNNRGSDIEYAFSSGMGGEYAFNVAGTGSVWFEYPSDVGSAKPGDYGFNTIIHETGHALGLDHMGDYNGAGNHQPSSFQDTEVYTVMSYFGPSGPLYNNQVHTADWTNYSGEEISPQTPMLYDVYVIQKIYGIPTNTRTGNTIYGFSSNITDITSNVFDFTINKNPILCIFDSSGTDTINLSGYTSVSFVNLKAGAFSSCNGMTDNISIAYNCMIENAITGNADDLLIGNEVNNSLSSGAGNDFLDGGRGNDTIDGGLGSDAVYLEDNFSNYTFKYTKSKNLLVCSSLRQGTDSVYNVESYIFNGITKSLNDILTKATIVDEVQPLLSSFTPARNTVNVGIDTYLTLTFNENIKAGTGSLKIYEANGNLFKAISINSSEITIENNTVRINPLTDFNYQTTYYLNYDVGVILDSSGNTAAAISDNSTISFTTEIDVVLDDYPSISSDLLNSDGPIISGAIESQDDSDFFEVALQGESSYQFDLLASNNSLDPVLTIFDPDGNYLNQNDDFNDTLNSRIVITPTKGGVYTLGVSGYDSIGSYTLRATTIGDDYSNTTATQGVVAVNQNSAIEEITSNGSINFIGDTDLFSVTLEAGVMYRFELALDGDAGGLNDPYLSLKDANLETLEYNDNFFPQLPFSMIFYTPTTSGTYYLEARDSVNGTGLYTLKAYSGTKVGTNEDDFLSGGAGKDTLFGYAGNDFLNGGPNADSMVGGTGDDEYYVDNRADKIIEKYSGGEDYVITTSTSYALGDNLEWLVYNGTGNFNAKGNSLDNTLISWSGKDTISAGSGDDYLEAYGGSDQLTGGAGSDDFIFSDTDYNFLDAKKYGMDTITDFKLTDSDVIRLYNFGDTLDIVWNKSEGTSMESRLFYSQSDGFIYYDYNENGTPFAIVQLLGKPYITDTESFYLSEFP